MRAADQAHGGARYSGRNELEQTEALRNYNRFLCRLFRSEYRGGLVVDFGAGIGTLADRMAEMGEIVCIEVDPEQAAVLRTKGYRVFSSIDALGDDSVAFAYSSNVLEHLDDDLDALRSVYRKVRPGGRLALFVPAFESIWTSMDDRIGHKRRYTREGLTEVVLKSGFRVDRARYVDSLGFLLAFLFRFIGSKDGALNTAHLVIFDRFIFPMSCAMDLMCRRLF